MAMEVNKCVMIRKIIIYKLFHLKKNLFIILKRQYFDYQWLI